MKRKQMKEQEDQCSKWKLWAAKLGVVYQGLRIVFLFF
ncbi:hypothetical protein DUGA2_15690 [Duganella sp. HH101]|nr:hypothetical protein DUGA2_15690 [Duganella sp. HH101]